MEQRKNEGNPDPVTWERFKAALTDKYFPRTVASNKREILSDLSKETEQWQSMR